MSNKRRIEKIEIEVVDKRQKMSPASSIPCSSPLTKYREPSARILRAWSDDAFSKPGMSVCNTPCSGSPMSVDSLALTDATTGAEFFPPIPGCSFASQSLTGAIFVGHVNTDLDSVAGAIGAAALFNGTACISEPKEKLNGEILHGLKASGLEIPEFFEDVIARHKQSYMAENNILEKEEDMNLEASLEKCLKTIRICLVDHTERKQMTRLLQLDDKIGEIFRKRIVGVIDHHALAQNFATDTPIFMDLRPWGSMSTIIAHLFIQENKKIEPKIAKILLSAILSDTLNLKSPTTTESDKFAVTLLATRAGKERQLSLKKDLINSNGIISEDGTPKTKIQSPASQESSAEESTPNPRNNNIATSDVTSYAMDLFKAKTEWICSLGPQQMASADVKAFEAVNENTRKGEVIKFGIGVLEIAGTPAPVLAHTDALVDELRSMKKDKNWEMIYLCVVDVVSQTSVVICPEEQESQLTKKAFGVEEGDNVIHIGNFASRKKQFMPMYTKVAQMI